MEPTNDNTRRQRPRPRYPKMADAGGQYAAPIGTSTRDVSDRQRDIESLADFNAAWQASRNDAFTQRKVSARLRAWRTKKRN